MKVKAPAEKNFKRAKVKPGRAKRSRSRVGWTIARHLAALLLFFYAGYRAVNLVVGAAPLQVGKIVVTGNVRLSTAEVEALTRRAPRPQHPDGRSGCLPAAPARVAVDRRRRAAAGAAVDDRGADRRAHADGHQPAGQPAVSDRPQRDGDRRVRAALPRVRPADHRRPGPVAEEGQAGDRRGTRRARGRGARLGRRRAARSPSGVSQVDVSNAHDVVVLLEGDPAQLHLGDERFVERLQSYLEVASALRERVADIDYVDLRFDERVYVEAARLGPHGGSGQPRDGTHTALKGDSWDARNAIWSVWTSAPPRSPPSSAK